MRFRNPLQREIYYISQIDFCYFALQEMESDSIEKLRPIESIIDSATGIDKHLIQQKIDSSIELLKCIIKCKKILSYDISDDIYFLHKLNKLRKRLNG
jgi:hypothetical protein